MRSMVEREALSSDPVSQYLMAEHPSPTRLRRATTPQKERIDA